MVTVKWEECRMQGLL